MAFNEHEMNRMNKNEHRRENQTMTEHEPPFTASEVIQDMQRQGVIPAGHAKDPCGRRETRAGTRGHTHPPC